MATQTFVSQEVKPDFLLLVQQTKDFYLNNPASELSTWIFLTREGEIEEVKSASQDGNEVYPQAECKFDSPVWLVAILDKNADYSEKGMLGLLPDLAEACQLREYYFTSRA